METTRIYCPICSCSYKLKDLKSWTGRDILDFLCPGCDDILFSPDCDKCSHSATSRTIVKGEIHYYCDEHFYHECNTIDIVNRYKHYDNDNNDDDNGDNHDNDDGDDDNDDDDNHDNDDDNDNNDNADDDNNDANDDDNDDNDDDDDDDNDDNSLS